MQVQRNPTHRTWLRTLCLFALSAAAFADTSVRIDSPMTPPSWALMERALLAENARLIEAFHKKYVNPSNGFLEVVEHWGGGDGPDDAMENFYNWPMVYILGGPRGTLERFLHVWEGHIRQYSALGMYHPSLSKSAILAPDPLRSWLARAIPVAAET